MNRNVQESIELLRRMVMVPSESFNEDAVCSLVSEQLSQWGIVHERIFNNIVARGEFFRDDLPSLAFIAHLDTVSAAPDYSRNPFEPGTDDSIVYGLGSNDDGGSVVSMIAAFRHFYSAELPFNLILVLSSEEERSGVHGTHMLFAPDGPLGGGKVRWAIVGEPTGMRAATSERGLLVIDAEAEGVSGHAARGEGINALYIALEDIAALREYKFEKVSPEMGEVRLNVTQISAGTAHNVIPGKCNFVVDIRPTEMYDNAEILENLQKICRSRLVARNLLNRSSATAPGSPLARTAVEMGIPMFSSPTTSDWIRIGCDAIKMGPGDSSRSHHADEYVLTSEIEDAVAKYIEFIDKFYGNTLE